LLTAFKLENFKAWRDTGPVAMAPLTVLFGANSSGKSSINHFLMMLKQTIRSPDRNSVFDFGDANSPVNLGSFRDVVFAHDLDRTIEFEQEWELDAPLTVRDPRSGRRYAGETLRFRGSARQAPRGRIIQSEGFSYELLVGDKVELGVRLVRDERRQQRWRLEAENYDLARSRGRAWELPRPVQFYGFPSEASVYFQNTAFLSDLELAFEQQLSKLSYLGPLRSPPLRHYPWAGQIPEDVGWRGDQTVQVLLAARRRQLNWKPKAPRRSFERVVADWLQRLGLIQSFQVSEIAPERDLYEVRVRARGRSEDVTLTDVGFGVSQVIPVIVQVFYAPANSTALIEQPELHLHPAAQAGLADLFIAATGAREGGKPRRVQLIVESHSEHLLRRLQRRIAEEKISQDDVAIYFCRHTPSGSKIERLELDLFGDIHNWPPNFFGDDLADVSVQAGLSAERRRAQAQSE
jgi:predicted ATPase